MGIKYWSTQWAIQARVNWESWVEWALNTPEPKLPVYKKPPKQELTAGVYNFIRLTLNELRP